MIHDSIVISVIVVLVMEADSDFTWRDLRRDKYLGEVMVYLSGEVVAASDVLKLERIKHLRTDARIVPVDETRTETIDGLGLCCSREEHAEHNSGYGALHGILLQGGRNVAIKAGQGSTGGTLLGGMPFHRRFASDVPTLQEV